MSSSNPAQKEEKEPTDYFALKKRLLAQKKEKAKKKSQKTAQKIIFRYVFNVLIGIVASLGCTLGFFLLPIIIPIFDIVIVIFYILGMRMRLWQWLVVVFLNFIAIFLGIVYFLIIYCIIHPVDCGLMIGKKVLNVIEYC